MRRLPHLGCCALALWLAAAGPRLVAAELPPAPILMPTTATVSPGPGGSGAGAGAEASPALPPPRQAALETQGMTPAQETRYRALTKELRCPLCQNQSIADSDAPISADLRDQVRARILARASDDDIRAFVTDRFGEFALYRPRFGGSTLWLWLAPLGLLIVGGAMVLMRLRSGAGDPHRDETPAGRQEAASATVGPDATMIGERAGPDAPDIRLARLLVEEGALPVPPASAPVPDIRTPA